VERRQAPAPSSADLPVPDFLLAEAGELIDGQYRDRPGLRPVLDAVLAALPALGPVTVQARKTLVSLVTPRRTFAVIQATTRTRLDLGLRLEDQQPGGRLLAARGLGAATARIALTAPQDVDDEVLDWPVPGNAPSARWEATVTVRRDAGGLDFSRPVRARRPHRPQPLRRLGQCSR
jgi:hypothetical protein